MISRPKTTWSWPSRILILVLGASYLSSLACGQCHKNCHGHGSCDEIGICHCYSSYTGPDCSLRSCPFGTAWSDVPTATDTAHASAECSNRGECDRNTGLCQCHKGFAGPSCNRMTCPKNCNGHGRCMNLARASTEFDGYHLNRSTSYVGWDAEMIHGCVCDPGFTGYDCSLKPCSMGPDPRTAISNHEIISLKCQCAATCSGGFRLSHEGRTTTMISPDSSTATMAAAILFLLDIHLSEDDDYSNYISISMSSSKVCGTASETQTDVTFISVPGDVKPFTILDYLDSSAGTVSLYMQTTQYINCTCGTNCGGYVTFSYDGMDTVELPYSASSTKIENALKGLPTLQSVYSLDVSARGQYDTLCPHAPGTNGFQLVIKAQSGNLPALQATSSLTTSSTGTPGGNITITTNDAETPVDYCNGIGRCDQLTGSCKCPLGFGFSSDRGECGTLAINSSQWTGIETCPGVIDQTSLQEITTYDEAQLYFTNKNRYEYNRTMSGIYIQTIDLEQRPFMLANLTGLTPGAIALDLSAREVYFIDKRYKAIGKQTIDVDMWANETGSYQFQTSSYLVQGLAYAPNDLTLDLRFGYRHAYFTVPGQYNNASHSLGKIMRMDLDGSHTVTTILSALDQPMGLALDLESEQMYFTDARNSSSSKIYRCNLDGSNLKPIMSKYFNISMPTSIALDLVLRKAFVLTRTWKTGEAYVMSFDMDTNYTTPVNVTKPRFLAASSFSITVTNTSDTTVLPTVKANLSNPEHMVLDTVDGWIFYTDSYYNELRRVNYKGTILETVVTGSLYNPVGLAMDFGKGAPRGRNYYDCFGHGYCTGLTGQFKCECYDGWHGNCNVPSCPKGRAWFDVATASDTAHQLADCSNRGLCDHATGTCICQPGFEGRACERMSCPGWENGDLETVCSGHGRCLTMAEAADRALDSYGDPGGFTYGLDPSVPPTWDAHMIQQCYCDRFHYLVNEADRLPSYTGLDCSKRECPLGDDPSTRGRNQSLHEIQQISCQATSGTFTLAFRGQTTSSLSYDVTVSDVTTALLRLGTLGSIELTPTGTATKLCSTTGTAYTNITYVTELGALPLLKVDASGLTGSMSVTALIKGTKDKVTCANHGICDDTTGDCVCFPGYSSSDYDGSVGRSGDCGYIGSRTKHFKA